MQKAHAREVRVRSRRAGRRETGQTQGQPARQPVPLGDEVPRGFLSILSSDDPQLFTKGSGRLELADAIVKQPIAMRVIVNRIWKGHFGTGIVDTPSNFGKNGERPTNPELLDYLAQFFVDHKLSIKALHREIMLSAMYQLSAANLAANFDEGLGQPPLLARERAPDDRRTNPRFGAVRLGRARPEDGRAVRAAHAADTAPHDLRPRQPLQARRVSAALRFPESEPVRARKAFLDERAAAAPVLHEQRLHAAASRTAGRAAVAASRATRRGSRRRIE